MNLDNINSSSEKSSNVCKVNFNAKTFTDFSTNEAFKTLRTNLLFCSVNNKVLLISSANPNEGKSTISAELSKSLAEIDKKVLLIDADLRKSVMITNKTARSSILGLSEYLSNQATLKEVLYNTQLDNFDVIFSGAFPPNPVELLSTDKFKNLINSLKEKYDYIIIDTPPINYVIDAAIIATVCDSSILVFSKDKTKTSDAIKAKTQLEKSKCKILGAIINQTSPKGDVYRKYYYTSRKYGK